jgi:hypothetical protein
MKHLLKLIILFIVISSCQSTNSTQIEKGKSKVLSSSLKGDIANQESEYYDYKNTKLKNDFTDTLRIHFSNDTTLDCFTLYVPKGNINKTKSTFKISTKDGKVIYENTFTTSGLVDGYGTYKIKNDEEMEKYVLSEAKDKLSRDGFIDLNNLTEKDGIINQAKKDDYLNYDVFLECKKDKRPLFQFGLEEENIEILGYSKKSNKVVVVITCC